MRGRYSAALDIQARTVLERYRQVTACSDQADLPDCGGISSCRRFAADVMHENPLGIVPPSWG